MLKRITVTCFVTLLAAGTVSFAQDGAATYKSKCQMCHGATGMADTPAGKSTKARPFNDPEVMKMSEADLINVTTNGHNKMPAYKGKLTDAQIKDVVAYIKTLQK
ncbi:MAG: cytochrome c [Silvibacterium sp.]|nr:cytochrome c [Silvibacterium sp.]